MHSLLPSACPYSTLCPGLGGQQAAAWQQRPALAGSGGYGRLGGEAGKQLTTTTGITYRPILTPNNPGVNRQVSHPGVTLVRAEKLWPATAPSAGMAYLAVDGNLWRFGCMTMAKRRSRITKAGQ